MNASIREFQAVVHALDSLPLGTDASVPVLTPASKLSDDKPEAK